MPPLRHCRFADLKTTTVTEASMDAREPTSNNAELWSSYLREQWRAVLNPFGLNPTGEAIADTLAEVAAANVAGVLAMLEGPAVSRLYAANAPEVNRFCDERTMPEQDVVIPELVLAY
jgi:hypothetical protein